VTDYWRVSCKAGGEEGYWADYMAGQRRGWRQRSVLDGPTWWVSIEAGGKEAYW